MGMTLDEAAKTLGVSGDASKKDINTAYRKLIGKYHPDAHRTESAEKQAEAEKMFKKVNQARQIMLDPSKADQPAPPPQQPQQQPRQPQQQPYTPPQAQPQQQGQAYQPPTPGARTQTSQPWERPAPSAGRGGPQGQSGRVVDDGSYFDDSNTYVKAPQNPRRGYEPRNTSRPVYDDDFDFGDGGRMTFPDKPYVHKPAGAPSYSTATTFHSSVPRIPDEAESELAGFYQSDAYNMYADSRDKFRITPSFVVSIVFLVLSIIMMMSVPKPFAVLFTTSLPYVALFLAMFAKMGVYDLMLSFHVRRTLHSTQNLGWLFSCGLESTVVALIFLIVTLAMGGGLNALLIVALLVGVGLMIAGAIQKVNSED